MAASLSRAGAAPLALGPVSPAARPSRAPLCDGTAAGKRESARRCFWAQEFFALGSRYIHRSNSRIGGGRWVMARWVERSGIY